MDNIFLTLADQVENMNEEEFEKLYESYDAFVSSLKDNEQLANEVKAKLKLEGATGPDDVANELEILRGIFKDISKNKELSENKQKILQKITEGTIIIYEKIIENFYFTTLNIPVELCHENAKIPTYAHETDAGFDFYLPEDFEIWPNENKIARTGLKMAIPAGYELQIRPRSGLSLKTSLRVANAPGTVDSGYRDEIGIICWNCGTEPIKMSKGDRIAQGVLSEVPKGIFKQVDDIIQIAGNRNGGFGSSGK